VHLLRETDKIKSNLLLKLVTVYFKIRCEIILVSGHSDIGPIMKHCVSGIIDKLIVIEIKRRPKEKYIEYLVSEVYQQGLLSINAELFTKEKASKFLDEVGLNFELLYRYRHTINATIKGFTALIRKEYYESLAQFWESEPRDFEILKRLSSIADFETWVDSSVIYSDLIKEDNEEKRNQIRRGILNCVQDHFLMKNAKNQVRFKTKLIWEICYEIQNSSLLSNKSNLIVKNLIYNTFL